MPRRPRRSAPCPTPGCPTLTTGGACPDHQQQRAPTAARGYGAPHQTIARQLRQLHPHGPCGRCHLPGNWDDPHDPLTAGHLDHDGPTVLANYQPEHRSCGLREAAQRRAGGPVPGSGAPH